MPRTKQPKTTPPNLRLPAPAWVKTLWKVGVLLAVSGVVAIFGYNYSAPFGASVGLVPVLAAVMVLRRMTRAAAQVRALPAEPDAPPHTADEQLEDPNEFSNSMVWVVFFGLSALFRRAPKTALAFLLLVIVVSAGLWLWLGGWISYWRG